MNRRGFFATLLAPLIAKFLPKPKTPRDLYAEINSRYETYAAGSTAPDLVVCSPLAYAFLQFTSGNPNSGWNDFVKADIRKRLAAPRFDPARLPA